MTWSDLSRRGMLAGTATAAVLGSARAVRAGAPDASVANPRVNGLVAPIGIDTPRPRMSWQIAGDRPGLRQGSYRVAVASAPALLASGTPDLWDSGRVTAPDSFDIPYAGRALASRLSCWWQMEAWDTDGAPIGQSAPSLFEMGLLLPTDWSAQWLAAEDAASRADRLAGLHWIWGSRPRSKRPRRFRWQLELDREPVTATLLICAVRELRGIWLNGRPQSFAPFRKGPVDFWRMVTVPLALRQGRTLLAAEAAWDPDGFPDTGGGALAAMLRLTYADGSEERRTSGTDWRTSTAASPGARWTDPDHDDAGWEPARPAQALPWGEPWPAAPASFLRRDFVVEKPVARARLYATALGAFEASLNGRQVGDAVLAPESTDFRHRILYRAHDVTGLLKPGSNTLGAHVGDGWYGSTALLSSRFAFGPSPRRLLAQLEIDHTDGSRTVVSTGPGWTIAESPVRASEIYDGEMYDARLEQPGWASPGTGSGWRQAEVAAAPTARLVAHQTPPIRMTGSLKPVAVRETGKGVHVFDFGQNFAGWCRLRARAPAGTTITLRFAEVLKADGSIDQANLRSAEARDVYTFRGDEAGEDWRPRFTYHGFRYAELTGWPGQVPNGMLTGEVIHSDLEVTGSLRIDDPLIDRIWRNTVWGQRSNFMGIPTDCPQRDERLGWLGDAQIFWDAAAFGMDMAAFTRRFMADIRDTQDKTGMIADFAPRAWPDSPIKGAPGWSDACVLLPWTSWWRYGDTAVIDENWSTMTAYADQVMRENPDFLWARARGSDAGDWLSLDGTSASDPTTPKELIATAYWAHVTEKLAEMAAATGRTDEARRYADRRTRIADAFVARFVQPDGRIGTGSQTGYILPLRFGLMPDKLRTAAAAHLAAAIRKRGTSLSTGFLGTPHALDVLADAGYSDLVYALLARTEFPSWGYMIAKGATTMWERWNSDVGDVAMNSFNHYAFGAVVGFFYRRIAGIDAAAPGFRRALIRPFPGATLPAAGADYDSIVGRFSTRWERQAGGGLTLDLRVPPNAGADVRLPAIGNGQATVSNPGAARLVGRTGDEILFDVGPGRHQFRIS